MRRSDEKTEEDRLLRDSARRFLEERHAWSPEHARNEDNSWQAYRDMGWLGMGLPEELGGIAADAQQCLMTLEEAGRVLLEDWLADNVLLVSRLPLRVNTNRLNALLQAVPGGDVRFALASADPRREPIAAEQDGERIRLSGRSALVAGAGRATHFLVVAKGSGGEPVALVIDNGAREGLRVAPFRLMDGRAAGVVEFDRLYASADAVLLAGEAAARLGEEMQDIAIAGLVADCIGALDAGFDATLDYLRTRKQFGQTLSSFQAVQHLMADAYCDRENLRSLAIAMAAALDGPADERRKAVSAAKAYLGRNGLAAAGRCIQACGGIAMTEDYFVGHVYKRLQTAAALFGNAEHHLAALA